MFFAPNVIGRAKQVRNRKKNGRKSVKPPIIGVPSPGNNQQQAINRLRQPLVTTVVETAACTESFGYAQRNPFDAFINKSAEVCMPDAIVLPTGKRRLMLKGTGSTGTTGVGYVLGQPYNPTNNGSGTITTTAASVGTTATAFSGFTNYALSPFTNGSYAIGDIGLNSVEYRICAFGIRVRFKGTQLNKGGTVYAYRSPSNSELWTVTPDALIPLSTCKSYDFGDEWVTVRWKIATPTDTDFASAIATTSALALIVVAATGDAQPFEYQAVTFFELVGSNVNSLTESHSDPVGFGAVQAVGARGSDSFKGKGPSKTSVVQQIGSVIKNSASHVKDVYHFGQKAFGYAQQGYQLYNSVRGPQQMVGPPMNSSNVLIEELPEEAEGVEALELLALA